LANPQLEDGHLRIANEVVDTLVLCQISGQDMRVWIAVARYTWGWSKPKEPPKEVELSIADICDIVGETRQSVHRSVNRLVEWKMITMDPSDKRGFYWFGIQKDYDQWVCLKNETMLVSKTRQRRLKNETNSSQKRDKLSDDTLLLRNNHVQPCTELSLFSDEKDPEIEIRTRLSKDLPGESWTCDRCGSILPVTDVTQLAEGPVKRYKFKTPECPCETLEISRQNDIYARRSV
jgi:phage replication O-like protein O